MITPSISAMNPDDVPQSDQPIGDADVSPIAPAPEPAAPDPDLGLLALRRLTEGYNRSSTLARRFRDSPIAAERTCRILGSSRILGGALYREPSFVDALADDSSGTSPVLTAEVTRDELIAEALDALD